MLSIDILFDVINSYKTTADMEGSGCCKPIKPMKSMTMQLASYTKTQTLDIKLFMLFIKNVR